MFKIIKKLLRLILDIGVALVAIAGLSLGKHYVLTEPPLAFLCAVVTLMLLMIWGETKREK